MLEGLLKTAAYRMGFSLRRLRGVTKFSGQVSGKIIGSDGDALMAAIHAVSPFDGFSYEEIQPDEQGWGSDSPAFAILIDRLKPSLIIEVGTWKGGSALEMARHLERAGLDRTRILCVDTWLGALEMWGDQSDPDRYRSLQLKNGYPQLYYQFLSNVCHRGAQNRIIPFPLPSATASQWLSLRSVRADLIYVDGSHEEEDVYADLVGYWDLLTPRGTIFGDDYGWTGVKMAVDRFAAENRLRLEHLEDKWVLSKIS